MYMFGKLLEELELRYCLPRWLGQFLRALFQ
jgi:hypothetical protein